MRPRWVSRVEPEEQVSNSMQKVGGKIGTSVLVLILDISERLIRPAHYMCDEILIICC